MAETDARDAELVEVAQKAEIVRVAFRTFLRSTEAGYDTGEVIADVVLAITPLIREQEREACARIADMHARYSSFIQSKAAAEGLAAAIRQRNPAEG